MKWAVITSHLDPAGRTIHQSLLSLFPFEKKGMHGHHPHYQSGMHQGTAVSLYTIHQHCIHAERLDKEIDADVFIFATKHESKEKVPSLSCHPIGNWFDAPLGGKEKELGLSSAVLLKKAYLGLKEHAIPCYDITLEATHHGPEMEKPCFFIEIGSSPEQWTDAKAAHAIAKTIMHVISGKNLPPQRIAIALRGTHYCASFNKILQKSGIAISHLCPKHNLVHVTGHMIEEAVKKTAERVGFFLLDWKGMGAEKERIRALLDSKNIPWMRTDKVT